MSNQLAEATFHFDPCCPWTWITSRWLVDVAASQSVTVRWRPLSLAMLNGYDDPTTPVPESWSGSDQEFREQTRAGIEVLRIVAALSNAGQEDRTSAFYTQWGRRMHVEGRPATSTLVEDAAAAAHLTANERSSVSDRGLDADIRSSTERAMGLAGPDVGTPVLVVPGAGRGVFGPIVSPAPTGDDALDLWNAVCAFARVPDAYEIKHGRPPQGLDAQARRTAAPAGVSDA